MPRLLSRSTLLVLMKAHPGARRMYAPARNAISSLARSTRSDLFGLPNARQIIHACLIQPSWTNIIHSWTGLLQLGGRELQSTPPCFDVCQVAAQGRSWKVYFAQIDFCCFCCDFGIFLPYMCSIICNIASLSFSFLHSLFFFSVTLMKCLFILREWHDSIWHHCNLYPVVNTSHRMTI